MTTQHSAQARAATSAYYLSFIIFGLLIAVEGPSLPVLADHTASRLDQISLIFVFGSLGYMIGSFFGGRAYDRLPGHRFMAFAMLVMGATAALVPVISSLWLLLTVMFVLGLAKGALDVGCNILLQWFYREKSGPFLNGLHFFFGVGSFLAPLLLAQIITATDEIHWTFWVIALLSLPVAAWLWTLPDPPHQAQAGERSGLSIPLVPVFLIVLCLFLYVGAEVGFGSWIYTYAITLGLGTTVSAAYLTSAFWGLFTVGRLLGVWVSTRLPSHTILILDLCGCLVSLGLIMLGRDSVTLLWAGSIGLGLFMASIFPATLTFAGERMPVNGAITGWFLVGAGIGGMFLPWLIGQAFVAVGPYSMLTIILTTISLHLLVFIFMTGMKRSPAQLVSESPKAGD
jgi:MFS transporter, FHS family, Na+ dependent glucose transporter 1